MKDRIQQILTDKKLSAARFAEILGVQPSSISHLLSGRNNPNSEFIVKLLDRFSDINPDWFLLGRGAMYRSDTPGRLYEEKTLPLAGKDQVPAPEKLHLFSEPVRKIEKIIVFFTDHTFSVYTENRQK